MKKLIPLLISMSFIFAVKAQSGDISGQVKNEHGEVLSKAELMLVNSNALNPRMLIATDEKGNYCITPLPSGKYTVLCQCNGYLSAAEQNVEVIEGKSTHLVFTLKYYIRM